MLHRHLGLLTVVAVDLLALQENFGRLDFVINRAYPSRQVHSEACVRERQRLRGG